MQRLPASIALAFSLLRGLLKRTSEGRSKSQPQSPCLGWSFSLPFSFGWPWSICGGANLWVEPWLLWQRRLLCSRSGPLEFMPGGSCTVMVERECMESPRTHRRVNEENWAAQTLNLIQRRCPDPGVTILTCPAIPFFRLLASSNLRYKHLTESETN